jgi:hypothetical protein
MAEHRHTAIAPQPTTDAPPPHYQPDKYQVHVRRTRSTKPRDATLHSAIQRNTMDNPHP